MNLFFIVVLPLLVVAFVVGPVMWKRHADNRLLESGVAATARVLEVIDTGDRENKNPVVRVRLSVRAPEGEAFPAEVRTVASPVRLQKLKEGAEVAVRYDAARRERVAIDTRAPSAAP